MRNKLVLAAILTVVLAVSAHGQQIPKFETGNDLFADFQACDQMDAGNEGQTFNCGLIWGYIIAIVD